MPAIQTGVFGNCCQFVSYGQILSSSYYKWLIFKNSRRNFPLSINRGPIHWSVPMSSEKSLSQKNDSLSSTLRITMSLRIWKSSHYCLAPSSHQAKPQMQPLCQSHRCLQGPSAGHPHALKGNCEMPNYLIRCQIKYLIPHWRKINYSVKTWKLSAKHPALSCVPAQLGAATRAASWILKVSFSRASLLFCTWPNVTAQSRPSIL